MSTAFDPSGVQVSTADPEAAAKSLNDVAEYAKRAHEAGESTKRTLEKVEGDLEKALRTINELQARANINREQMDEGKGLKHFIARHDSGEGAKRATKGDLVLAGRMDPETKQWIPGLLDQTTGTENEWAGDLRRAVGDLNMVATIKGSHRNCPVALKRLGRVLDGAPASVKSAESIKRLKAFVDSSGSGGEWIIDLGIPDLIDNNPLIRSPLADRIMVHNMAAKEEVIPAMTTGLRPYKYSGGLVDDPAQFTSSSLSTQDRRRTTAGMAVFAKWDRDAAEDSILNMRDVFNREISLAIRDGREDCLINGDTTASHQDAIASWNIAARWGSTGLGGAGDHRRSYDGFRAYAFDNTWDGTAAAVNLNSSQTWDGLTGLIARLSGTGGMVNSNTIAITSKAFLVKMFLFDEFKQQNWNGQGSTIANSSLLRFGAHELLVSDFMGSDLNASGVYDGVTTTKTGLLMVNLDRWEMNRRLGTVVETDADITRNQGRIVARVREALWSMEAASSSASNQDAVFAYNLDA